MASILETNSVTKKFGGFTAVDNVSLSVNSGEVRFIIGPNGAGKSTFFKLVIGFHTPNSGSIKYKDQNIEKLKLHERINLGMGVKFQAPSVFSDLTVLENLSLANNRNNSLNVNPANTAPIESITNGINITNGDSWVSLIGIFLLLYEPWNVLKNNLQE